MSIMKREDAEEYTDALGQVVAGGYRQVALGKRLGVPQALGLTVEQWVEQRLGGYVRMSIPDRREAVVELTEEGMSTREISEVLGVGNATVHRDRDAVSNGTDVEAEPAWQAEPEAAGVPSETPEPIPGQTTISVPDEEPEDESEPDPSPPPEREAEINRTVAQTLGPEPPETDPRVAQWERVLGEINSATKRVRALPPFPEQERLLALGARDLARVLSETANWIADAVPDPNDAQLRRVK